MRLRITRQLDGSIDGIHLEQFVPGQVYEVGTGLGSYLLSMEAAEPAGEAALTAPLTFEQQLFRAGLGRPADQAADRDIKGKGKKRNR
jgi:hypothetical protein